MRKLRSIVLTLLTIVLLVLPLSISIQAVQTAVAQLPKLKGTVKDPSGAVMPGVEVSILQGSTVMKAGKSNAEGSFSFDLATGAYLIAVTAPDFKTFSQPIRVTANMPSLSVTLSLEGMTAVVNVNESLNQPIVDASLSLDATTITGDQIADLPDDEESLLAYLQSLAGGDGNAQLIIDGFEGGRLPTRDQIAQIVIEPNSFNANGTGPRITIVSKQPGPTRWAGNLSYQYRDSALNARTPGSTNKPSTHQSAVSLGYNGPVIKGKLGMNFNLSKEQSESGGSALHAITPAGPVNAAYVSPSTYDSLGFSQNWYLTKKHTLYDSFSYSRNKSPNGGIGGFTLPERAYDSNGHGWNMQVSDNLTISSKMTNTFSFRMNHNNSDSTPRTNAIAINVLDAFNGGGSQNRSHSRSSSFNLTETLRWTPNAKLNIQFAFNANHQSNYNNSQNNYLGTFTFSSLDDYLAGNALTFTQTSGNPEASTKQSDANTSIQLTYRIKQTMSFSAGAQYTIQTHLRDYNNISPTAQYQAQIKKRSIISIGARLSYPNVGFSMGNFEQLIRGDGTTKQFNTVISRPSFPDPFAFGTISTTGVGSSRQLRDLNFVSPYTLNTQLSLNESLPKNWRITTSFNVNRSVHQMRNRNINAPYPGTPLDPTLTVDQINLFRPLFPITGRINQYESTGNSLSKNLNFTTQIPSTKKFFKTQISGQFRYGLTWAADDSQAQNPYNVRADWARNDQRQQFQATLSIRPPRLGSYNFNINANSGRAYSITTGKDDNFDQAINDRPAGIKRNSLRGPGGYTVNLNYSSPNLNFRKKKATPATTGSTSAAAAQANATDQLIQSALAAGLSAASIQQLITLNPGLVSGTTSSTQQPSLMHPVTTLSVSVNNLLNNTRINGYSGVITSPLFGKPTSFGSGRSISLSLSSRF